MKQHKEQDVDAKKSWYILSIILIVFYIGAGLYIMFSSLFDDEFSQTGRYFIGGILILFALYRGYTVFAYLQKINKRK